MLWEEPIRNLTGWIHWYSNVWLFGLNKLGHPWKAMRCSWYTCDVPTGSEFSSRVTWFEPRDVSLWEYKFTASYFQDSLDEVLLWSLTYRSVIYLMKQLWAQWWGISCHELLQSIWWWCNDQKRCQWWQLNVPLPSQPPSYILRHRMTKGSPRVTWRKTVAMGTGSGAPLFVSTLPLHAITLFYVPLVLFLFLRIPPPSCH